MLKCRSQILIINHQVIEGMDDMNEIEIQFIKSLGTAVITGVTFLSVSSCNEKQEKTRLPNIIYIMADDLGYNDLGCYGAPRIQTPNIYRMAADGIRFTQHYAGTSVSAPSWSTLMTGQHTGAGQPAVETLWTVSTSRKHHYRGISAKRGWLQNHSDWQMGTRG